MLPFYSIAGNLLLGIFVLLKNWKSKINLSFALTALLTALWACSLFFYNEATTVLAALIWCKLSLALYAYLPIPFMCFFSEFPEEDIVPKTYQMVAWFCVATFFAAISASNLIVKDIIQSGDKFVFIAGPAFVLFVLYFLGFIFFAFNRLTDKYRSYKGAKKQQIAYVLIGFFLGIIFPVIINFLLPLFGNTAFVAYGPFSTIFTILIIAFAITKSHLMDISIFISRTLAELLTIVLHAGIYLSLVWAHNYWFSMNIDLVFILGTMIYGIIVGQTHQTLRLFFQTTAEKLFIHGKYNYYKSLSDASIKVGQKMSLANVLHVLYDTFSNVIEISNPRVFLPEFFTDPEKESQSYVVFDKTNCLPQNNSQKIGVNEDFIVNLIEKRKPVANPSFPDAKLIIPCLLENRLIGFFALGKKLSEDRYTDEDLRLLEVLASQAAVTLDHTRSYEKIALDLQAAEHQLERSQRLAAIGTLTAGVTHEIRNPLTVIRAETERLANQPRDQQYLNEYKDLLLKHITRIEAVVQKMLGMAREKTRQEIDINLNEQIESILSFFQLKGIALIKQLGTIKPLKADPQDMQELFVNLIQNAIDAMPAGGNLIIKTYMQNERIVIDIIDTGKGIPDDIKEKIFDPFFSTRHEGVGLGLSIVYRIVRQYGGDIKVISELGKGSTFKLLF